MLSLLLHVPVRTLPEDGAGTGPRGLDPAALLAHLFGGDWSGGLRSHPVGPDLPDLGPDGALAAADREMTVVCSAALRLARPSRAPSSWLHATGDTTLVLGDPDRDWCALGTWRAGDLRRALSLSTVDGIEENVGAPGPVETPFWAGAHPIAHPERLPAGSRPLPFHPYQLACAAAAHVVGPVELFEFRRVRGEDSR